MAEKVPQVTLSDGVRMPAIGFGTSGVCLDGLEEENGAYEAIRHAIKSGYRFFDTAALYLNEHCVGQAINDAIREGEVEREDLFVCTKVWNTAHRRKSVERACYDSLKRLHLDYIDLYLIHWPTAYEEPEEADSNDEQQRRQRRCTGVNELVINPRDPQTGKLVYSDTHYTETWQGMEDVRDMDLVRSIGLSNFNHSMIDEILAMPSLRYAPTLLQVELHPYLAQVKLADYCRQHGIVLNAYCPLGAPKADWITKNEPKVMEDALINRLAEQYGKSPAQIILRYHVERGIVPIPKSSTSKRIDENIDVFDFSLGPEEMQQLMALDRGIRYCLNTAGEYINDHKFYPFHAEY